MSRVRDIPVHDSTRTRDVRVAAVGVARRDEDTARFSVAGVGGSHPGVVGAPFPARVPLREAARQPDSLLVLHSDGLPSRWVPPHLPAVMAAVVLRDAGSAARPRRDDAGVAVRAPGRRHD
ncbi:hypothetical protein ABTX99_03905 [Streptomyces flaveolus]|uniref:hypothetical protein n=1 Tax=Streptomyces flaveolus TaxID=67297 RepID=UPI00332F80ED